MVDPSTLLDIVVNALRSNANLLAALGTKPATEAVIPYYTDYSTGSANVEQQVFDQKPGTAMVCWTQTRTGNFNKGEAIKHDFAVYLKPQGRISTVFLHLREGVVTSPVEPGGAKFKLITLHSDVNPIENLACRARTNFVSQNYGLFDFSEVTFTLTERGADV